MIRKDVLPEDIVDIHKNYILTLNLTREDVFKTLDVLQKKSLKALVIVIEIIKDW